MSRERWIVLITHHPYLINVIKLVLCAQLANVVLHTLVAGLNDVPRHFQVSVDHKTLVGHIGVDANLALMENRILRDAALPAAQINVAFKLSRVGGAHNNSLTRVTYDWVISGVGVRVKSDDELEVALFRIGPALFSHVITCRLGEVKPTDRDLADLTVLKVDATE